MSKKYMATLVVGPCHGQVVEIVGMYFQIAMYIIKRYRRFFYYAKYIWGQLPDGTYVGNLAGYYDSNGRRVDKLGRKIGRRKCA